MSWVRVPFPLLKGIWRSRLSLLTVDQKAEGSIPSIPVGSVTFRPECEGLKLGYRKQASEFKSHHSLDAEIRQDCIVGIPRSKDLSGSSRLGHSCGNEVIAVGRSGALGLTGPQRNGALGGSIPQRSIFFWGQGHRPSF